MRHAAVVLFSLSLFGCAAVFRGSNSKVTIESTPAGAEAKAGPRTIGATPAEIEIPRAGVTQVTVQKEGYEDHVGTVKKGVNPAWVTFDIIICPITLCIPLLVDAVSGGWNDVDDRYVATMKPGVSGLNAAAASASAAPDAPSAAPAATSSAAPSLLSESERKATARAAYLEGVKLQDAGKPQDALARFETAQKFYSAPTHLLRIAQCQAATGKLVEAAETYETLVREPIGKDAPDAFKAAQEDGGKELKQLRPRVPTLRIQLTPAPNTLGGLVVKLNGKAIPSEVLGIARPVNPGKYSVTVWAAGYRETTGTVDVVEGAPRALDLKLLK